MNLQTMCLTEDLSKGTILDMLEDPLKGSLKELLKANTLVFKKELKKESLKDSILDSMKGLSLEFEEYFEMHEQKTFPLMVLISLSTFQRKRKLKMR